MGVAEERFPAFRGKLARRGADGQLHVRRRSRTRSAAGVDHLLVAAYLVVGPAVSLERRVARCSGRVACAGTWSKARDQRMGAPAQLAVDLAVELACGEQVGEHRGEHHRDRDRGGRDERDAPAKAHTPVRLIGVWGASGISPPSGRIPRRARCATGGAPRRPRSCGADSPCRRPATWSSNRSHSPRRPQRSPSG